MQQEKLKGSKRVKNNGKKSIRATKPDPCGCYYCSGIGNFNKMLSATRCRAKFYKYPKQNLEKEIELSS